SGQGFDFRRQLCAERRADVQRGAVTTVPPTTQGIQIVNGNLEVTFVGIPGEIYSIEATQNLNPFITWTTVAPNLVADANGLFKYVDTQFRSFPMRFFRARTP